MLLILRPGTLEGMYPIDVPQLVRRGTLGSRADDPTLPSRPRRLSRLVRFSSDQRGERLGPKAWQPVITAEAVALLQGSCPTSGAISQSSQ